MKYIGFLAVAGLVLAFAAPAGATSIATESFNSYPLGDLNSQNGGTGWANAWTAPTGAEVVADTSVSAAMNPLQYQYGGLFISGGDRTLQVTGNSDNLAYRTLASSQSGDVWFSYLARWQSNTSEGSNKFVAFWFDNVTTGEHLGVPNIGLKTNLGAVVSGTDREDFVVRLSYPGAGADWAGDVNPPELSGGHFVVGHLYKASGSTTYNAFEMWVDPFYDELNTLHSQGYIYALDNTDSTTLTSFNMVGIRSGSLVSGDAILIDQIALGTTLNDVLGGGQPPGTIPEPVTMAGLGLGLVGLVRYVRRRR
jgi:hypothetical protein